MINSIRSPLLRRAALCAYTPPFLILIAILGLLAAIWDGVIAGLVAGADAWEETTRGSIRVVRETWRE